MVASWIKNIQDLGKNDPAVKVQSEWLNSDVSEVYILIPENDPPCYLIFEDENRLLSFPFNGNIDMLSNILDFRLK